MRWIVLRYESRGIRDQICHPHFARVREMTIESRYGVRPIRTFQYWSKGRRTVSQRISAIRVDLGGMILRGDRYIETPLSPDRTLLYFDHQVSYILKGLLRRKSEKFTYWSRVQYYRVCSKTNHEIFISQADRVKLVRTLWNRLIPRLDPKDDRKLIEALMKAAAKAEGLTPTLTRAITNGARMKLRVGGKTPT